MKLRTSFVSNSSSSSYVCDITGEAFEVQDSCFRDAGLVQCPNGHVFKEEFILPLKNEFPVREQMLIALDNHTDSKKECDAFRKLSLPDLQKKYSDVVMEVGDDYYCKPCQCPLCTLTRVTDSELLEFMFKSLKTTRAAVMGAINEKFDTDHKAFQKYLKTK